MLQCNIIDESGSESMFFATVDAALQALYASPFQRCGPIVANAKNRAASLLSRPPRRRMFEPIH
jgi:hypothetical protein